MNRLQQVQQLVGPITQEQMRYVDIFVSPSLGIFMPVAGPCFYSISHKHTHPAYSFIISHDGRCQLEIDNRIITPSPGTLCAISPQIRHHEIPQPEFSRFTAIFIKKDFFEKALGLYKLQEIPNYVASISEAEIALSLLCKEFMQEYENKMPGQDILLEAISLRLTHAIIRSTLNIKPEAPSLSSRIEIEKALEYINLHFDKNPSVSEIAASTFLSTSHFSRVFKQEVKKSPTEYLISVKLNAAKKLLRAGDKSITEVALDCGFNSSSHFSTSFQAHFNQTPSQFMRHLNNKQNN